MKKDYKLTFYNIRKFFLQNLNIFFCGLSAIIIISICSKSSPLYPFNDWLDSNCFFTVGKSMFKGLVPYKDLIEQKGPLLYLTHAFASLISYKTFFGVYLLEIIAAFFFLYLSYKILKLFCGTNAFYFIPFLAFVVYRSKAFCHGDSAEELCLPLLTYTLFIALRYVRYNEQISNKEFLLTGIFASCVFWTKFTLCGIYVGWFIPFAIDLLIHKQYRTLLNSILYIALGLICGTIPWIIYFGINHAIIDWLKIYIYDNIFLYASVDSDKSFIFGLCKSLLRGFSSLFTYFRLGMLLLGIGGIYCYLRKWYKELIFTACMLFSAFFFSYIGGITLTYYSLIISPFVCLGFVPVFSVIAAENEKNHILSVKYCWAYILLIIYTYICAPNNYLMKYKKDELPQYKFSKIISKTPDATLLTYGLMDGGFYTTTGIIPNCKAFCSLNVRLNELEELQNKYVHEGLCDYIVTRGSELEEVDINHLYIKVAETKFYFEEDYHNYYLYKLKSVQ